MYKDLLLSINQDKPKVYNTFRPQGQYQPNPADQAQADYYRSLIPNQQGGAGTSASNPQQGYPQQGYTGTYA
jgi:hypothetical protein